MTLQIDRRPVPSLPALTLSPSPGVTTPSRGHARFYLVGEAERSRPAKAPITDGRTSISINGRRHMLRARQITFEQIVRLAFPHQPLNNLGAATVMFSGGVRDWPTGTLTVGDIIEVTDTLRVNASATFAS